MRQSKEFRSSALRHNRQFDYLPDQDRYLVARSDPHYRVTIIGVGIIGQEHLNITHLEGRATVHGVYDPNPRSIQAAQAIQAQWHAPDLVIYDNLEAACADPQTDALIICTPNYTHLEVVRVAVASGKHILLEKPIATTIADAIAIRQLADAHEAVFQIGLQYRYKAMAVEALHEVRQRRSIGAVKLISMQEHRIPFLDKVNQWNKFAKYSGDSLIEKCCHYFDLMNYLAQSRPQRIFASGGQAVNFTDFEYQGERSDILDHAYVIIDYENGIRANFSLCMFAPMFYEELVVCGDRGRLRAWEQVTFNRSGDLKSQMDVICGEDQVSRHIEPAYPSWIEASGHHGASFYGHRYFIDNIEGKLTNTATAQEGMWSVIVAALAQESIKQGRAIDVAASLSAYDVLD